MKEKCKYFVNNDGKRKICLNKLITRRNIEFLFSEKVKEIVNKSNKLNVCVEMIKNK